MAYVPSTSQPWIFWWSGDVAIYFDDRPIVRQGREFLRVWFIPLETLVNRYNIDERDILEGGDIDYSKSEWGVMAKDYPSEHVQWLSRTPINPVVVIKCKFDGTEIIGDEVIKWSNRIVSLNDQLKIASSDNMTLREQYKVALERIRALQQGAKRV